MALNPKNALGWDEAKRNCEEQKGSRNSTPQKTTMDFAHKLIHAIHQLRMQIPLNTNCTTWELAQGTHYIANYAHNCSQLLTIQSNKWFQLPEQFIQHASPSTPQNWKSLQQQQSLSPAHTTNQQRKYTKFLMMKRNLANRNSHVVMTTSTSDALHFTRRSFIHSFTCGGTGWRQKHQKMTAKKFWVSASIKGTPRNYITQMLLSLTATLKAPWRRSCGGILENWN